MLLEASSASQGSSMCCKLDVQVGGVEGWNALRHNRLENLVALGNFMESPHTLRKNK